jgi:hypothetical protein
VQLVNPALHVDKMQEWQNQEFNAPLCQIIGTAVVRDRHKGTETKLVPQGSQERYVGRTSQTLSEGGPAATLNDPQRLGNCVLENNESPGRLVAAKCD